ncbi:MAG: hypothetical protein AUJ55_02520 [Proteobacteria bacterium CG1_02_64_396]|nr:MAG: hypothetical protein AUJ55_02520 [Proteobacteria bacterium CG1_02_64_396]
MSNDSEQLQRRIAELEGQVRQVETAHREWLSALDSIDSAVFMHDLQFRILRANRAYQRLADRPYDQIVGQPYYTVFPLLPGPLASCQQALTHCAESQEEVTVGQRVYRSRAFVVCDDASHPLHSVHILDDITQERRSQLLLHDREDRLRGIFNNTRSGIAIYRAVEEGADFVFVDFNPGAEQIEKLARGQVVGRRVTEVFPGVEAFGLLDVLRRVWQTGQPEDFEPKIYRDTRVEGWRENHIFRLDQGDVVAIYNDVTVRKQAEADLRDSEERYRTLFESSRDALVVLDRSALVLIDANPTALALFGLGNLKALRGLSPMDISAPVQADGEEPMAGARRLIDEALSGAVAPFEWLCRHRDGAIFPVEAMLTPFEVDGAPLLLATVRDISERKRHEAELQASHDLLRSVVENIPHRVFWKDSNSRYLGCNTLFARDAGLEHPEQLLGKDDFAMGWRDQAELYRSDDKAVMDSDTPKLDFEEPQTTPEGGEIWLRTSKVPLHDEQGAVRGVLGIYADVTEEHNNRLELQRANIALRTIGAGNSALIHAKEEGVLLREMCRAAVEQGGYRFAWIGYALDDPGKTIEPQAWAGQANGYLDALTLTWGGEGRKAIPSGEAIRTGEIQLVPNVELHPGDRRWIAETRRFGFSSCVALPLMEGGRPFGVLVLLDDALGVFGDREVAILNEMAGDLAYGVRMLRIQQAHAGHERQIRNTLLETVQTVAAIVEMRDPYTAGHQRRVADLALAIGHDLGWDDEHCQALYLAGVVHDVGKINIPAEILSRPSRLTPIELEYVRSHAQAGYEILKPVHFPWPIAEIVHQHHERLDGSGYPQGLQGDDILPEAKILMVADVVEAISSHRPYRPSLGMEAALDEIESNRGTLFDPEVVDACLRLIRDKGFVFRD